MRFWNIHEDIFLTNQRLVEIKVTNSFYLLSGRMKLHEHFYTIFKKPFSLHIFEAQNLKRYLFWL